MNFSMKTILNLRCGLALLALQGLNLSLPAAEPAGTNAAPTALTNRAAALTNTVPTTGKPASNEVWLTFNLDHVEFLQTRWLGNPLWQYLASLIYIVLAFYVSKFLDYLIQVQLKKWTAKTKTQIDDLILTLLHGPVKVIAFVIFLHIGLNVFDWPTWAAKFISNGLKIVVACSLTYLVIKLVDLLMQVWQQRVETSDDRVLDTQLLPVIRKSAKIFVAVVATLVTCQNLGMNITGLLASLSIGGLAIGLAAQDTLSNLFGAVAIFADKPFKVGDRILLDSIDGNVETIGLRSTRVRNQDGYLVTIPNRTMANASITNVSRRPRIKTEINIGLTYDTTAERVQQALQIARDVFGSHPNTDDLIICFNKFQDSSLNVQVVHWWKNTDHRAYLRGLQEMNLELKRRFDEEGIEFAFPTQTMHVRPDPKIITGTKSAKG